MSNTQLKSQPVKGDWTWGPPAVDGKKLSKSAVLWAIIDRADEYVPEEKLIGDITAGDIIEALREISTVYASFTKTGDY